MHASFICGVTDYAISDLAEGNECKGDKGASVILPEPLHGECRKARVMKMTTHAAI